MRISFEGFENPVDIAQRGITALHIESKAVFARVCNSLITLKGANAVERYSIWDDDGCEINPANAFMVIVNPFDLPWKHKNMMGALYSKLEGELLIDEELRQELQCLGSSMESTVHKLGLQLNANYGFGVEWNLSSYLKAFSYEVELFDTASLFDNLISFIDLGADMAIDKVFVFINLKTFLTKNELIGLNERLFFLNLRALLIENHQSKCYKDCEKKYTIDRDFVEYVFDRRSESPSSSQGRICSNGFGAVTI